MSKIPFENNYNGIKKLNISSKDFYIKMAKMCLIEEIIKINMNKNR